MEYKDNFHHLPQQNHDNPDLQSIKYSHLHRHYQSHQYQPHPHSNPNTNGSPPQPPSAVSQRSHSYSSLYSFDISPITKTGSRSKSKSKSKPKSKSKTKSKSRKKSSSSSRHKSSRRSSKSSSSNNSGPYGLNYNDYEVLDTVGCGSFAKVSRVRRKSTKEILVWKELAYGVMSDKEKQMLCDEVNILRNLNHPNIVQFVDRIIDHQNRKIYIVQEYCDGGDLASYIKLKKEKLPKMSGRISESFIWSVTSEIASALQHCHNHFNRHNKKDGKRRILHRDLKPGNVFLVKRRGTYSVKLGDFGLAKMLDESSIFAQTHVGTPYYMSPEQIQSKSYNEKSDIWSLGCIVYEMAMLSPPFKAANYLHLAEKIKLGVYKKVGTRNYSQELEDAISMMLTVNSHKRAKVEDVLCLPRIQFTSKMLRLDRRYCQLKKKELQFSLKMQEFESKYKIKSMALLERENLLKRKESELKRKEAFLASKTSLNSTNSGSTNSGSSPGSEPLASNHSEESRKSGKSDISSSKQFAPILKMSPMPSSVHDSIGFKRTTSNVSMNSMLNTSKTSTLPSTTESVTEKKEESPNNSSNNSNDGGDGQVIDGENSNMPTMSDDFLYHASAKNHSQDNVLETDQTRQSIQSTESGLTAMVRKTANEEDDTLMDDARNYLMKKVNLSDLNGNNENGDDGSNDYGGKHDLNDINMTSRSFDYILNQMNHMNVNTNHSYQRHTSNYRRK